MSELENQSALQRLQAQLGELRNSAAPRFDPVRYCYIESMLQRAQTHRAAVSERVSQRALFALEQYLSAFSVAKEAASGALEQGLQQFPLASKQLQQHYDNGDFVRLNRLLMSLQQANLGQPLVDLVAYVAQSKRVEPAQTPSFDDLLREAEHKLVHSESLAQVAASRAKVSPNVHHLNAMHHFRESLVRRNADKLVTQAIREIPEDAGPLNSQKLMVQSLASMRDLSPHYLNRFVAYIDTLLWLEQSGTK